MLLWLMSYLWLASVMQRKAQAIDQEFETMYAELRAWRAAYGTTIVPKQASAC